MSLSHVRGLEVIHVSSYDLVVEQSTNTSIQKPGILLSRNHPVALIIGSAGFIGSHVTAELLNLRVQVIGVDDLSLGRKENLTEVFKNSNFHFLHQSIEESLVKKNLTNLPRLDYAIFSAENLTNSSLYKTGLANFLEIVKLHKSENNKNERPKVVLISSIQIYDNEPSANLSYLKSAENQFAKFIKQNKLSGRVVRLAGVYGPKMHFRENETFSKLIKASLENKLSQQETTLSFSTRGLFIDDAVSLILKSIMAGATSGKIYDGALPQPLKVEEIKQILINPDWYLEKRFIPTELPPWLTPNLDQSLKELSWYPKTNLVTALKTTISFFADDKEARQFALDQKQDLDQQRKVNGWSFKSLEKPDIVPKKIKKGTKNLFFSNILLLLFFLAVLYPFLSFIFGTFGVPSSLDLTRQALENGNLQKAKQSFGYAKVSQTQMGNLEPILNFFIKSGVLTMQARQLNNLLSAQKQGLEGIDLLLQAVNNRGQGTINLFSTSQLYLAKTLAALGDENLNNLLLPNKEQLLKKDNYQYFYQFSEDGSKLSRIIPYFLTEEKSYLFLIQNNSNLQPQGGKLIQIGELNFRNGRVLVSNLKKVEELDFLLAQKNIVLSTRNINSTANFSSLNQADFPSYAQTIKALDEKLIGQSLAGIIAIDKTAVEDLNGGGSQTDLTSLAGQLTESQNIFKTVNTLSLDLNQKHILIYSENNQLKALLANYNWDGAVSAVKKEGLADFLQTAESNRSAVNNKLVDRQFVLKTTITQAGEVSHSLTINYTNNDTQNYQANLALLLPLGSKLVSAKVSKACPTCAGVGESSLIFNGSTDFGRAVYNGDINISPGASQLVFEYSLSQKLEIGEAGVVFSLKISKQPGTNKDPFVWQLSYPFSWDLMSNIKGVETVKHQINIETNLDSDKTFNLSFKKH